MAGPVRQVVQGGRPDVDCGSEGVQGLLYFGVLGQPVELGRHPQYLPVVQV